VDIAGVAPDGILVQGLRTRLTDLTAFRQGWFQVQDEASQLVSLLLAPRRGKPCWMLCRPRRQDGTWPAHGDQAVGGDGPERRASATAQRGAAAPGVSNVSSLKRTSAAGLSRPEAGSTGFCSTRPAPGGHPAADPDIKWRRQERLQRYHTCSSRSWSRQRSV